MLLIGQLCSEWLSLLQETAVAKESTSNAQLKKNVEEEWRLWGTMPNENDKIQHFSRY